MQMILSYLHGEGVHANGTHGDSEGVHALLFAW